VRTCGALLHAHCRHCLPQDARVQDLCARQCRRIVGMLEQQEMIQDCGFLQGMHTLTRVACKARVSCRAAQ
jgi:hypothetical protein